MNNSKNNTKKNSIIIIIVTTVIKAHIFHILTYSNVYILCSLYNCHLCIEKLLKPGDQTIF